MKLVPTKRFTKRLLNVTEAAQEWTVEIGDIPNLPLSQYGGIKRPVGSAPLYWLYVVLDSASNSLLTGTFQYYDGTSSYTIISATQIIWRNSEHGYVDNTVNPSEMVVAIPETLLVNRFYVDFGEGNDRTGSAWLMAQAPAFEGCNPESFGHYYITRHLTTLTIPDGESVTFDMPTGTCFEEPMYLCLSGSLDISATTNDGNTLPSTPTTITSGFYSDTAKDATPILKFFKYAESITFTNSNGGSVTVKIDLPVLSL